ncbi:peptidase C39 [uncultured Selenomonas sp.]|uniref:peptidase C39 n=1 Tax=uncultured Selenomonas sp. TaxID=159275 RepID=UPI0028E3885C|nr:peptidase C39 [uncultured Selenomonas sp.]
MKIPLRYQMSEYDCGPTALLNAVSYLFPRREVPPEIIRSVMLYTLDCYGMDGTACKAGTSRMAMMYLANWLEGFSRATKFPLTCQYISGRAVHIGAHSYINDALVRGGAAVVRLFYEVEHYALLTGASEGHIYLFDPYYLAEAEPEFVQEGIAVTLAHPNSYNRIVPFDVFNRETQELYAFGVVDSREAVLLFDERTRRTADDTIEYFI